ncbi:YdcF family protein [Alicyclobacillaceae bacterium I2511]|nr:YdcF family protein [Alicyclobacillaceae bacterium I2511]
MNWGYVAAGMFLLGMGGFMILLLGASWIRYQGRRERPCTAEVAIVLGAYTDGFQPSRPLMARLHAALWLYRLNYVRYLIVSGGKGADETVSESRSMKRFLMLNGVPAQVILEDTQSNDTWENLLNSHKLMERLQLRNAVVVTSDYHLPRALAVARQLRLDVCGYAAWSSQEEFHMCIREVLAGIKYTLGGQAAWRK